jgi:hypothetical protein
MKILSLFPALLFFPSLLLGQNPGSAAAVSSEAATVQPKLPARLPTPTTAQPAKITTPPPPSDGTIDPLLDPNRPKNCQLEITSEQTLPCGEVSVVLPSGIYKQITIVEGPEGRKAIEGTELKPQAVGIGYIRYQADTKFNVGGKDRVGGIDVGIRPQDNLPVRIWYKKMTEVDDITKAFTFIFPPVGLIAGAGAWSSGNILLPEKPILFTEARDYYLKTQNPSEPQLQTAQPAIRLTPATPQSKSGLRAP